MFQALWQFALAGGQKCFHLICCHTQDVMFCASGGQIPVKGIIETLKAHQGIYQFRLSNCFNSRYDSV